METLIIVLAIAFGVGMLFLLPKYAKFIHEQPKKMAALRKQREEENAKILEENSNSNKEDG